MKNQKSCIQWSRLLVRILFLQFSVKRLAHRIISHLNFNVTEKDLVFWGYFRRRSDDLDNWRYRETFIFDELILGYGVPSFSCVLKITENKSDNLNNSDFCCIFRSVQFRRDFNIRKQIQWRREHCARRRSKYPMVSSIEEQERYCQVHPRTAEETLKHNTSNISGSIIRIRFGSERQQENLARGLGEL